MLIMSLSSNAKSLDLVGYQNEQGAITVAFEGDFVDPYFATRALLTAHHAGLDIKRPADAWIAWLLPRQEANGLFKRFCRHDLHDWASCADADADDALLAMWIELLYVMAPPNGLPPAWQKSVKLARTQLNGLYEKKSGIYLVSTKDRVGLLMDNVEIYAALRSISTDQKRLRANAAARATRRQAAQLRQRIEHVFHPSGSGSYRVSTQPPEAPRFYPEEVAQIYPWLYRMPSARTDARSAFRAWLQAYGADWLSQKKDHYPWGLVALTAQQVGDVTTALCWSERAAPLRYSDRWNVLEEAVFQVIDRSELTKDVPCQGDQKS